MKAKDIDESIALKCFEILYKLIVIGTPFQQKLLKIQLDPVDKAFEIEDELDDDINFSETTSDAASVTLSVDVIHRT